MDEWLKVANGIVGGTTFLLVGYAVFRGKLVLDREYKAMRDDRDYWKNIASTALKIGQSVVQNPTLNKEDLNSIVRFLKEHTTDENPPAGGM